MRKLATKSTGKSTAKPKANKSFKVCASCPSLTKCKKAKKCMKK